MRCKIGGIAKSTLEPAREAGVVPRRLQIIYNPVAGSRSRRTLGDVLDRLEAMGCVVDLAETTGPGDGHRLAAECSAKQFDVVIAAGGDGTINEVINGMGPQSPPLALIPLGTANVFALEIGLPLDPARIAAIIATGTARRFHTGRAGNRRFVQMVGVGFDAHVVAATGFRLKKRFGKLAYVWRILYCLIHFPTERYRVHGDGFCFSAASVIVCNGQLYGGAFKLCPAASVWSPGLHVCVLERSGRWHLVRYIVALAFGRLDRLADVRWCRTQRVRLEGADGSPVQADGDIVGDLPIEIEAEEVSLRVLVP